MTRERCDCRYPNGHDVAAGHVTAAAGDGDAAAVTADGVAVAEVDGVAVEHVAAVAVVAVDVAAVDIAVMDVVVVVAHAGAVDVGRHCREPSVVSSPST